MEGSRGSVTRAAALEPGSSHLLSRGVLEFEVKIFVTQFSLTFRFHVEEVMQKNNLLWRIFNLASHDSDKYVLNVYLASHCCDHDFILPKDFVDL